MNEQEIEDHKRECLARWRKYWRLAQIVAALPSRQERQAAVAKHEPEYPWFPDLVMQAWKKRRSDATGAPRRR